MAPSLQDLIDFLLAEIALCGVQGASISDISTLTNTFYAKAAQNASQKTHTVDRRFQAKVWSWLTRHPEVSVGKDHEGNRLTFDEAQRRAGNAEEGSTVRVFVSEERTWLAVTGHEPDVSKISPAEFALLSIIANRKSSGIPQPDLAKFSGQDKRSVPKRTDALEKKGYIQKRAIQLKGVRTSLCTLCKFLKPEYSAGQGADHDVEAVNPENRLIDFKLFCDQLFGILKEYKIISRHDLKALLNFTHRWQWKVLSRTLRKFERIGIIKRVKAPSQYEDTVERFHSSVMLLREPSERDFALFHEFTRNLVSNLENKEDADEPDEDLDEENERDAASTSKDGTVGLAKREGSVEDAGRSLPSWTPDRNFHYLIFEAINKAGISGLTNQRIARSCFGAFFRRPLEHTMCRLCECWQISQPPHLRHLAIIRDTALKRTHAVYIHYSAGNFKQLVEAGESSWEAVEFPPKTNGGNPRVPPVDAVPQLDEYGLPLAGRSKELVKDGNSTLLECMTVCKPVDYTFSHSDLVAVQEGGGYAIRLATQQSQSGTMPRANGRPSKIKKEIEGPVNLDAVDDSQPTPKAQKAKRANKSQRAEELMRGMSELEKFKAMGMDENWTEYSACLIDRPKPGVYVTPTGRRRPVGKSRGRPRMSRLAIFKSPKLASLPWFVPEGESDAENEPEAPSRTEMPVPVREPTVLEIGDPGTSATPARGTKRGLQRESSDEEATPTTAKPSRPHRGRQAKQTRRHYHELETLGVAISTPQEQQGPSDEADTANAAQRQSKRKRQRSPAEQRIVQGQEQAPKNGVETDGIRPKKPRQADGHDLQDRTPPATLLPSTRGTFMEPAQLERRDEQTQPVDITMVDQDKTPSAEQGQAASNAIAEPARTQDAPFDPGVSPQTQRKGKRNRAGAMGSVAVLRRKIIMDTVERAGGAFPFGSEIWYPFTTSWMRTKFKEKPDMRTIRSTVKHLIDAGKLRQQTFSGRDSKGVMVTKSMIAKPEISPDAPLIKDMQHQMLTKGTHFYFPPSTEVNPGLVRTGSNNMESASRGGKTIGQLPVERGITVHLQHKPSLISIREKRDKRQALRELESKNNKNEGKSGPKVPRLMTLRHGARSAPDPSAPTARPGGVEAPKTAEGVVRRTGKMRQLRASVVSKAPYAMLMSPKQTFHAKTGTFGTGTSGLPLIRQKAPLSSRMPYAMLMSPKQTFNATTGTFGTHAGLARQTAVHDLSGSHRKLFTGARTGAVSRGPIMHDIAQWELENEELLLKKGEEFDYINQTADIPHDEIPRYSKIRFDTERKTRPAAPKQPPMTTRGAARERRLEKLTEPTRETIPRQPTRRNRTVNALPQSFVQRVMSSIVAIRVLVGGIEAKNVDWPLIGKCFPNQDSKFVQDRAKTILGRNRLQIAKMQGDFQERFVEAYANDQVPAIDYNDIEGYDWAGVVDWAQTQLDVPASEKLPDLPATRAQFDSVFELREEAPISIDEAYHSIALTFNRKRALFAGIPFAETLPHKPSHLPRRDLSRLEIAKTWVRANITTPEESYNPLEARTALSHFGESLITNAVQSLVTDRVIRMGNRGRITPGRNYDITEPFITTLRRRHIESTQLRRAVEFKTTILDPALQHAGSWEVNYTAADGDILALVNLAAEGQVTFSPRDPPRDKYGLTDGGYLTRQIDRRKFRFAVDVYPVPASYTFGNPIQEKLSNAEPPQPNINVSMPTGLARQPQPQPQPPKLPIWLDIHGHFFKLLWDLVSAAVLGCLASRPGLSAAGVAGMIRPAVLAWEVEVLLRFLEGVGVVKRLNRPPHELVWELQQTKEKGWWDRLGEGMDEPGWVVREGWWMAVP